MKKYQKYIDSDEWEFIPYNSHDVDDYNTNKNGLTPNSELEIKEFVSLPNGLSGEVNSGGTHEQVTDGNFGTPMLLPPKTKVFSEKLKITVDGKKKSYAKIAKKLATEKDIEALDSPIMDRLSKKTAELNIKLKNKELDSLFEMQEMNKLNGLHGKQVAKETKKDYQFKLGGMKKYAKGEIPPEDAYSSPEQIFRDLVALGYTGKADIGQMQQWIANSSQHRDSLLGYLREKPITNKGREKYGIVGDLYTDPNTGKKYNPLGKNYTDEQLLDAFMDKRWWYRFPKFDTSLKEGKVPDNQAVSDIPNTQVDKLNLSDVDKTTKKAGLSQRFNYIPLPFPDVNTEYPLTNLQTQPHLIGYRPTDIEGQLNEIRRQGRLATKKLGTLPTELGAKSEILANSLNAVNQAFGNKYNQDIQAKLGVDEFNARALAQNDLSNLGFTQNFLDNIQKRKGAIGTQQLLDKTTAMENYYKANQWANSAKYIDDTFGSDYTGDVTDYMYNPAWKPNTDTPYDNETTTVTYDKNGNIISKKVATKKNGGKIKIKPKKVKK